MFQVINHALGGAESSDAFVLLALRVSEVVLSGVIPHVKYHSSGKAGQDSILLELEAHDGCVRLSIGTHSHSLLRVPDCVVEDSFGARDTHG